ncbi:MAG: DeoR/GlpR transcriptional regulator [Clostridia bacterium]|nr:DeoR/GlpR transcriptional regulator [Clostridia bacterium]
MLKNQRQQEIIHLLKQNDGFVSVKVLCDRLYASESSIRRDLTAMEKKGIISKTYGGAELIKNFANVIDFSKRFRQNTEEKKAIAKKAKTLIKDGSVIFLDQSSTSYYLAGELMNNATLTVITNNIEILSLLSDSAMTVIASGGILSRNNRNCLLGIDAQHIFENTNADAVFFSTKSLSDDGIISDCVREEVLIRNSMLKHASKKVFLCDSGKFGTQSPYTQTTLQDIDILVSEQETAGQYASLFPNLTIL